MRTISMLVAVAAFAANAQVLPDGPVNLDKPGALEALQKDKPSHYRAVMQRVHAVGSETCESAARVYRTKPDEVTAACRSRSLRTSFPAQTIERVRVDHTLYQITVYLDPTTYKLARAK